MIKCEALYFITFEAQMVFSGMVSQHWRNCGDKMDEGAETTSVLVETVT